jgi:MoxR-like ATPase
MRSGLLRLHDKHVQMVDPSEVHASLQSEVGSVLVGNEDVVERLTIALLTRGHVLLEGVPGVAKTTIANLFANGLGLEYGRIQLTPDVLPADITGTHIYRESTGEFELQRGPIFANLVVADEINRATPKTQSALLESMQERAATIEGETRPLPVPFMLVATQNPIEMEGTHELPEAQRDRFTFKLAVDLPDRDDEREVLDRFDDSPVMGAGDVEQVVSAADVTDARDVVAEVHVEDAVKEYILDVVGATREHPDVEHGGSPRATLALLNGGKGKAAIEGREYVIPDDVKELAAPALVHRLVLNTEAELGDVTPEDVVADVLSEVPPPGSPAAEGGEVAVSSDGGELDDMDD